MPYLGRPVTNAGQFEIIDDISSSFNGSNTSFTLQVGGTNILPDAANVIISLDGVTQIPDSAYSITGSTINFTEAPLGSTSFSGILAGQSQFIESGYITNTHVNDSANISGSKINTDFSGKTVTANSGSFNYITASVIDTDASTIRVGGSPINKTLVDNLTTMTGSGTIQGTGTTDTTTFSGGTYTGNLGVSGSVTVKGTLTAQEFKTEFVSASIIFSSGSHKFGDTPDDIQQMTGSLRITGSGDHYITDGNVGIGTSSPRNDAGFKTLQIGDSSTAASQLVLEDNDSNGPWRIISNQSLIINDDTAERMRIDSSGKVGIGLTNPANDVSGLHIAVASSTDQLYLERTGSGTGRWWIGTASNKLYFQDDVANATRMTIDSSGNVGIGVSAPDSPLHVHKATAGSVVANVNAVIVAENSGDCNIQLLSPVTSDQYILFSTPSGNRTYFKVDCNATGTSENLGIFTNATERITVLGSGNVGINETNPSNALDVQTSAGKFSVEALGGGSVRLASNGSMGMNVPAGYNYEIDVNGSEVMRIDSSGRVGIGQSAPKSLLQIDGENAAGVLTISHGGASNSISDNEILGTIDFSGYDLTNTYAIGAKIQARANGNWADASTNYAGTDLEFYTQDDSTTDRLSSPRMVINKSGKVGIGTASPTLTYGTGLNIYGGNAGIRLGSASGGWGYVEFADETDTVKYTLGRRDADEKFYLSVGSAMDSSGIVMDSSGNVGIGTASPSSPLHVNGEVRITDTLLMDDSGGAHIRATAGVAVSGTYTDVKTLDGGYQSGLIIFHISQSGNSASTRSAGYAFNADYYDRSVTQIWNFGGASAAAGIDVQLVRTADGSTTSDGGGPFKIQARTSNQSSTVNVRVIVLSGVN